MSPSRVEAVGIVLVVLGAVSVSVAVAFLAGWPAALMVAGGLAGVAGVILVRLAAVMPPSDSRGGVS